MIEDIYCYESAEQAVASVKAQFCRYGIPPISGQAIDKGILLTMGYVTKESFFPQTKEEISEYHHNPQSCKWRIEKVIASIEVTWKHNCFMNSFDSSQMACVVYGALLFSWSEEGEEYLEFYKKTSAVESMVTSFAYNGNT